MLSDDRAQPNDPAVRAIVVTGAGKSFCPGLARDRAANCSSASMAHIKQQVLTDWERGAEDARLRSLVLMSQMGQHPDFLEGVTSFQEKRAPRFQGLDAQLHVNRSINR